MQFLPAGRHIIWSCDPERLDPDDPWVRRWWIRQVLEHGRMEDVRKLDLREVESLLPRLNLPREIASLWKRFFNESRPPNRPDPAPSPNS